MNVFIFRDGEVSGPFSRVEIFAGLKEGTFSNEDTACAEGSEEWKLLQMLLTGRLGVSPSKESAADAAGEDCSAALEAVTTSFRPETTTPDFAPLNSTLTWTEEASLLPKPHCSPSGEKRKLFVSRVKDLAATAASLGLLFLMVAVVTFAIGRNRFLHTANIVAIQTGQISSDQQVMIPKAGFTESETGRQTSGEVGSVTAPAEPAASFSTGLPPVAKKSASVGSAEASTNQQVAQTGLTSVRLTKGQTKIAAEKKLFDTPRFTPRELLDVLKERFAATPVNTTGSMVRQDPNVTVSEGSFLLDTGLAWNPQVEVIYSIPLNKNATAGPRAANMLMWADWPGGMAPPKEIMVKGKPAHERSRLYDRLAYYTRELGYTAFSMHLVTKRWDDPEETYFLGGSQWVDLVFKAQDELTRRFKLPPRKLMLTGVSIGAAFAERITAARPDKVAAVALLSAPEITLPKQPSDTLWYLQINRGDSMQIQYNALYNALQRLGSKVLFDIFPPDYGARGRSLDMYHTESALDAEATRSFLDGVVSRRNSVGDVDPPNWPFVRDQDRPYLILSKNSPDLDRIPIAQRMYLPSERMVRCLQTLPVPVHAVTLPQPNGRGVRCFVGLPPLGRPRGVLIYAPQASYQGITDMLNDVYFLSGKGYLVLCPYTPQPGSQTLAATLKFVQDTPLFGTLPVVLVGVGERATQLWQETSRGNLSPAAMVLLKFKPKDLFDESKLTAGSHPIRFPVLFVEDEAQLLSAATSAEVEANLADARQIDDYIARCRERHQISRVILIPTSDSSQERNAQKTVQAINDSFADLVEGHRGTILK